MKSHRFDPLSFVFGLIFLLVAGAAVWNESFRWDLNAWVLPAVVLFLGIALLAATLRSSNRDGGMATAETPSAPLPGDEDQ